MVYLSKLEMVTQLQKTEARKEEFKTQLKAVKSHYFEYGGINFKTNTCDFDEKGTDKTIEFDKHLMTLYLQSEITELERQSDRIIEALPNSE